ncbi:MAG: glycosidase [Candidatus Eremiobacteraeota bacterium]|nr:glycosidase [Candidatus Eremiobacteraeota bacterium]
MPIDFDRTKFCRSGIALKPGDLETERLGVLNPACARLRNGTLQLYPRMVAEGNVSRIGSFRTHESESGTLVCEQQGFALEPEAPYEIRTEPGGYGCEDPRVTFIEVIDRYVMAYVAFGLRGPEVAVAASKDGLKWERLGLVQFQGSDAPFADKDAAFFPEPVRSPGGVQALALYHRPTIQLSIADPQEALRAIEALPPQEREGIAIGYVPLEAVFEDLQALCTVIETHRVTLPEASWGLIKTGAGAPPVRLNEGWLAVIHGVDELDHPHHHGMLRYSAGIIVHDLNRLDRILYRSPKPLFVPEVRGEVRGTTNHVVFPTGIDRRSELEFDIYYGMADYEIGRGRLTLSDRGDAP